MIGGMQEGGIMLYTVKEPFEYITQGKEHVIESLEIGIPKGSESGINLSVLEQQVKQGLTSLESKHSSMKFSDEVIEKAKADAEAKAKNNDEKFKLDEELINSSLFMGDADLNKCHIALKALITKAKSYFNDDPELKLNSVSYEEIPGTELQNLLTWYILNFTNTSL